MRRDGCESAGISSGEATSRPSAGNAAARLTRTTSSCAGVIAPSRTRSPVPGRAESAVRSGIESVVAMGIRRIHAKSTGSSLLSPTDRLLYGQMLLQAQNPGQRDAEPRRAIVKLVKQLVKCLLEQVRAEQRLRLLDRRQQGGIGGDAFAVGAEEHCGGGVLPEKSPGREVIGARSARQFGIGVQV